MSVDQSHEGYENNSYTEEGDSGQGNNSRTSLIINYLPQSVKEHQFVEFFASIGPLKSSKLMYDRETGYSFGYGFVDYKNPEDAAKAIETFNGYQMQHKRLKVAYSRPNTAETKNTTLYVRNVPEDFTDEILTALVEPHGEIIQARCIKSSDTGKTRGIAFVIMGTKSAANAVIHALDGYTPEGAQQPLNVKLADMNNAKKMMRYTRMGGQDDPVVWNNAMYGSSPIAQAGASLLPAPIDASSQGELFEEPLNPWIQRHQEGYNSWMPYLNEGSPYGQIVHPAVNYGPPNFGMNGNAIPYYGTGCSFPQPYPPSAFGIDYGGSRTFPAFSRFHPAYVSSSPYPLMQPGAGRGTRSSVPRIASPSSYKRPRLFQSTEGRSGKFRASTDGNEDHLLYVYGLKPNVTREELYGVFAPYGDVERVDVIMDNRTGQAKG